MHKKSGGDENSPPDRNSLISKNMKNTIFLSKNIEVLIVSAGGVGTTFLMEEIGKYKKTNCPSNTDGYKHMPVPPISGNQNLKVVYVFGNPIMASMSLFRRNYHHLQSLKAQQFLNRKYVIPAEMSLEAYAKNGQEGHHFRQHFHNWSQRFSIYPTLFIRYESLFEYLNELADFLDLPAEFIQNFPEKKERKSNIDAVSSATLRGLNKMYDSFLEEINQKPAVFIRAENRRNSVLDFFSKPYYTGIKRIVFNKIIRPVKKSLLDKSYINDKKYPAFWFQKMLGEKAVFVVQIGSNDGKTNDPLYPLFKKNQQWKGLFVEPIPVFFEKLTKNYPDQTRFTFENVAINQGAKMPFYYLDTAAAKNEISDLPFWAEQLGSFDKEHILKHLEGRLEPWIISQEIEGISLPTLLSRNKIKSIDILHVDAEGYDWKILSQLDLRQFLPTFILFEYHHLPQNELENAHDFLNKKYELFYSGIDMLAVNRSVGEGILKEMSKYMKSPRSNGGLENRK